MEPRLAEARSGDREVFFVDAAHVVFAPFLGCLWCFARMFVRAPAGRKRYNVLGALHAVTREVVRVSNQTYINAESVCELLRKIASMGLTTPITLVMDNARYQRCQRVQELAAELQLDLLFLPSYSPNLNLIERLWRFVKKKALYSIYYKTYEDFQDAIDQCLAELTTTHQQEIQQLSTHRFQSLIDVPFLTA